MLTVSLFAFAWTGKAWIFRILGKAPSSNKSYIIKLKEFAKMSLISLSDAFTESAVWGCLSVKELLAWSRCNIWRLTDSNKTRTHSHLVGKGTLNHLVVNSLIVNSFAKFRSSRPDVFCKKGVLRNFEKFTGKHLSKILFFTCAVTCNFIKKETLAQVISCKFWEIPKNTFSYRTFLVAASVNCRVFVYILGSCRFECHYSNLMPLRIVTGMRDRPKSFFFKYKYIFASYSVVGLNKNKFIELLLKIFVNDLLKS